MPPEPSLQAEEDAARVAAAEAAIRAIERSQHDFSERLGNADFYAVAGTRVMNLYRERIENRRGSSNPAAEAHLRDQLDRTFQLVAIEAERGVVIELARKQRISSTTAKKLLRELDLSEARHRV